jgi:formyltetrahydrofolate-dependent phosphoribosylglycinamide formyltransferase
MKHRVVVLVSGSGSNLQAILDAVRLAPSPLPSVEVVRVVSNRRDAYALQRAAAAGVATLYFPLKPYTDAGGQGRAAYDRDLAAHVAESEPDLVVLAGWMHILSAAFLDRFPQRVINLHPALPGEYDGANAIARAHAAFEAGQTDHTGVMVHNVTTTVDGGEVVLSERIAIAPGTTLAALEAQVHAVEHGLLVRAIGVKLAQLYPHLFAARP